MATKEIIQNGIVYTVDVESGKEVKPSVWDDGGMPVKYTRYNDVIFYESGNFQACINSWGVYEIWDIRQKGENAIMKFSGNEAKLNFLNVWNIIDTFA